MAGSRHADNVFAAVQSSSAAAVDPIAASWRRSLVHHGLDPEKVDGHRARLTDAELTEVLGYRELLLRIAQPRIDALFSAVGGSGFCVALTDEDGVILARRSSASDEDHFDDVGLRRGCDWSEAAQGTNGIGTCLYEKRAVIVHRDEHFMSGYSGISCIDAPLFGADGELIGALDVSSGRSDHTGDMNRMIGLSVSQFAQQIEADLFAAAYADHRIMVTPNGTQGAVSLLAVDESDVVVGATRAARTSYQLGLGADIAPIPVNDLLNRDGSCGGLDHSEKMAIKRALVRANGNASEAAKALKIGRATLYRRMQRLGIDR
ncbi:MAG: GAF domain-containing protein [Pseudomonadota bacterium]